LAISAAVAVSQQGMKIAAFEQLWSVMVRILSKPLEGGSLMMRSMAIFLKGRVVWSVVMGQWGVQGQVVRGLVAWQVAHPRMKEETKSFIWATSSLLRGGNKFSEFQGDLLWGSYDRGRSLPF
jgi:hypothetical protein